jgi:hypothetical protein
MANVGNSLEKAALLGALDERFPGTIILASHEKVEMRESGAHVPHRLCEQIQALLDMDTTEEKEHELAPQLGMLVLKNRSRGKISEGLDGNTIGHQADRDPWCELAEMANLRAGERM